MADAEKGVAAAALAAGAALVAAGPVGWAILGVGAAGVAVVAYAAGSAEAAGDREEKQRIILALEDRLRDVESELTNSKRVTQRVVNKLLVEREALKAEIRRLKGEAA